MADNIQCCFERYEKKYLLTPAQQEALLAKIGCHLQADRYGQYPISNIYYDTDDWQLVRTSIARPVYKEKLRVRSYGVPGPDGKVFMEIKKKYKGVVYKRRVTTDPAAAQLFLSRGISRQDYGQIGREIAWFQQFYHTSPKVFIGYDRTAYAGVEDPDLRITFDTRLRWRTTDLDLRLGDEGQPLLPPDKVLMEIKIPGTAPLWLSHALAELGLYATSFSKYGSCYCNCLLKKPTQIHTEVRHYA